MGMFRQAIQRRFSKTVLPSEPTYLANGSREALRLTCTVTQPPIWSAMSEKDPHSPSGLAKTKNVKKQRKPSRKTSKSKPTTPSVEGAYVFTKKALDLLGIDSEAKREALLKSQFRITANRAPLK